MKFRWKYSAGVQRHVEGLMLAYRLAHPRPLVVAHAVARGHSERYKGPSVKTVGKRAARGARTGEVSRGILDDTERDNYARVYVARQQGC